MYWPSSSRHAEGLFPVGLRLKYGRFCESSYFRGNSIRTIHLSEGNTLTSAPLLPLLSSRYGYGEVQSAGVAITLLESIASNYPEALRPILEEVYVYVLRVQNDRPSSRPRDDQCKEILRGLAVADPDLAWTLMTATARAKSQWRPHSSLLSYGFY